MCRFLSITFRGAVVNRVNLLVKVLVIMAVPGWSGCGESGSQAPRQNAGARIDAKTDPETGMPPGALQKGKLQRDASDGIPQQGNVSVASDETAGHGTADLSNEISRHVPGFYSVPQYDERRDPAVDLAMTTKTAQETQKRILIQVGGDWCNWCGRLSETLVQSAEVRSLLEEKFLIMKVASQTEYSEPFLADYPRINSYPHMFVLSAKGELLHSQDMEELEQGEGYDEDALLEFLEAWVLGAGSGVTDQSSQATQ